MAGVQVCLDDAPLNGVEVGPYIIAAEERGGWIGGKGSSGRKEA